MYLYGDLLHMQMKLWENINGGLGGIHQLRPYI